jgi:phage-related baseplate assembly protein
MATGAFSAVDLSGLPFPAAVESLDFETILAAIIADLQARSPQFTALLESDPGYKLAEAFAYRELLVRQHNNESIKAVMLAYAAGSDLDQIAARYDVERLLIQAADDTTIPPTPAVYEDDDSLRRRVQLAFEGFSTAGPVGAYIFHALSAHPKVMDAAAESPTPGAVEVAVLSRDGDGTASDEIISAVSASLNGDDTRPMTDQVTVQSAVITNYTVQATINTYSGPDSDVVMAAAQAAIEAFTQDNHRMGRDITLSGIYAALQQTGVQEVILDQPAAKIVCDWNQAAYCTGITLTYGGNGD